MRQEQCGLSPAFPDLCAVSLLLFALLGLNFLPLILAQRNKLLDFGFLWRPRDFDVLTPAVGQKRFELLGSCRAGRRGSQRDGSLGCC